MKKRGQIWVETMIYTLIAFVMLGLVLYFVSPKIAEAQDRAVLEQSVNVLEEINTVLTNIGVPGNKRLLELEITKGKFTINGSSDKIIFEMESKYIYSEQEEEISYGNLIAKTEEKGNINLITLTSNYPGIYNLTYQGNDQIKTISQASTPYKLFVSKASDGSINFELG